MLNMSLRIRIKGAAKLADQAIDWYVVTGSDGKKIGALGFIGDKVAIIAAFYDDRDGDEDGNVSWGEAVVAFLSPLSLKGRAVTEVAMAARNDIDVISKDPSFYQESARMFIGFAGNLIKDGIYTVYFSQAVSALAGQVAGAVTSSIIKQFVIRKGFEAAVRKVYDAAMKNGSALRSA
jgi:hypothetical protein